MSEYALLDSDRLCCNFKTEHIAFPGLFNHSTYPVLQVATNLQAITIIPAFRSELTNSTQNGAEKKKIGETG
jgi:hypothetical protein